MSTAASTTTSTTAWTAYVETFVLPTLFTLIYILKVITVELCMVLSVFPLIFLAGPAIGAMFIFDEVLKPVYHFLQEVAAPYRHITANEWLTSISIVLWTLGVLQLVIVITMQSALLSSITTVVGGGLVLVILPYVL